MKICPKCGSENVDLIYDRDKTPSWSVDCFGCAFSGPRGDLINKTIDAWNRRTIFEFDGNLSDYEGEERNFYLEYDVRGRIETPKVSAKSLFWAQHTVQAWLHCAGVDRSNYRFIRRL